MNPAYAILLGLIQGLTEFLPISSTAHLTLAGKLLGLLHEDNSAPWTAFIAVMQLGTLLAVVLYFFRDIRVILLAMFRDLPRRGNAPRVISQDTRLGLYVLVGSLPIGVAGLFLSKVIESSITKSTLVIIGSLVTLSLFLWMAEKLAQHERAIEKLRLPDALLIGVAQVLALIPGSSRSGTTITAALFLGFTRPTAARFSFLLSIPAILASGVYELTKIDIEVFEFGVANLLLATMISCVSGYVAISWLMRYLWNHTTMIFVWYRFGLGALLAMLLLVGFIQN